MNERIQELAYQAEEYADSIVDAGGEFHPAYTEKLAELIVKECADLFKDSYVISAGFESPATTIAKKQILKHFGVEQ